MNNFIVIFSFAAFLLLVSCNNNVIPTTEANQDKYYQFVSSSPKEKILKEIIDFFGEQSLPIKTINKDSGLITTQVTSFLNSYTWKDSGSGNPKAFVVCSMNRAAFMPDPQIKPNAIIGQWIVILRGEPDKTTIDMKLANASGKVVVENSDPSPAEQVFIETHNLTVKSTGVFEKEMERAINK